MVFQVFFLYFEILDCVTPYQGIMTIAASCVMRQQSKLHLPFLATEILHRFTHRNEIAIATLLAARSLFSKL